MKSMIMCGVAVAVLAGGCGAQEADTGTATDIGQQSNPLEASGAVELFVKITGQDGSAFVGESDDAKYRGFIPAIQFYSDITKATAGGATKCTNFHFTKAAGGSSPRLAFAISSAQPLNLHMEFVKPSGFVWQMIDLTGVRVSMLEQGSTDPVDGVPSGLLEEVAFTPVGTANVTITSITQSNTGGAGPAIAVPFTCKGG